MVNKTKMLPELFFAIISDFACMSEKSHHYRALRVRLADEAIFWYMR